jgi:hypothetical protein
MTYHCPICKEKFTERDSRDKHFYDDHSFWNHLMFFISGGRFYNGRTFRKPII